jgi:hypothetical protein
MNITTLTTRASNEDAEALADLIMLGLKRLDRVHGPPVLDWVNYQLSLHEQSPERALATLLSSEWGWE